MATIPTGRGTEVVDVPPSHCPAGHRLLPGRMIVAWTPCACTPGQQGHMSYLCRADVDGRECGTVVNVPACSDPAKTAAHWSFGLSAEEAARRTDSPPRAE